MRRLTGHRLGSALNVKRCPLNGEFAGRALQESPPRRRVACVSSMAAEAGHLVSSGEGEAARPAGGNAEIRRSESQRDFGRTAASANSLARDLQASWREESRLPREGVMYICA